MADDNITAPAATAEDNIAAEILAKLQALPDVKRPTSSPRSPFMKKFSLLTKLDPRRLEIVDKKNATHVCSLCNECVHFDWRRGTKKGRLTDGFGSYDTTKALKHLTSSCSGGGKDCDEVLAYQLATERKQKRKIADLTVNLKKYHAGRGATEGEVGKGNASNKKAKKQQNIQYMLNPQSYRDRALCAQAHFFLYSKSSIPLSMFKEPLFKEMLEAMIPPQCTMEAKNPPILNRFGATEYANSEFELFKTSLNKELAPMVAESKGNAFCQILHDGVTLGNKSKYQAFGLQFTNAKFHCNHVVALGFKKVRNSTTDTVSSLGENLIKDRTNFNFKEIVSSSVQDAAAKSVANAWELEVETCDMHDGDKVGASAIGRLVRKDGRRNIVNPFPEGQGLEKKLNNQAKHFSASGTNRQRYIDIIGSAEDRDSLPQTMIKQDLCGTRMSSFHGLVRSTLKIKKCLDLYFANRKNERNSTISDYLDADDWQLALETEAILNISKDLVTISQTETKLNAAYGPVVRNATYKKLVSDKIEIIDTDNWGATQRAPRKEVDVNTFSRIGRICRQRAILECERRFFGHNGEETMDEEGAQAIMKLSRREKAALVLDKRTCMQSSILPDRVSWLDAVNELKKIYVEFYQQRKRHDRETMRLENGQDEEVLCEATAQDTQSSSKIIDIFGDGNDSDEDSNDDSDEEEPPEIDEQQQVVIDGLKAAQEFQKVIKKWLKWKPDWKKLFPEMSFAMTTNADTRIETCEPDPFEDFIHIDMSHLMKVIEHYNKEKSNVFGYLPMMCRLSPCQLGALNAQSFVERMNSCAKLIVGEKRTKLKHEFIDKLVILRMNHKFMIYCRGKHGSIGKVKKVQNVMGNDEDIYVHTID